jgi:hypothetical protein
VPFFDPGSADGKIRIRDKHPGSATLDFGTHFVNDLKYKDPQNIDLGKEKIAIRPDPERHAQSVLSLAAAAD